MKTMKSLDYHRELAEVRQALRGVVAEQQRERQELETIRAMLAEVRLDAEMDRYLGLSYT